jgi:isoquinoline 1-oxidoreductase beta subunit
MGAVSRRGFLGTASALAGAMTLGWSVPEAAAQAAGQVAGPLTPASAGGTPVGIWVVIKPDDSTIIRIARSEMGQGTLTGLAQLVADELGADWSKVSTEYVPPEANHASKRAWGDMLTGGSQGIRMSVDYVRQGGAAGRLMLEQAAAKRWGVDAGTCKGLNGAVTHAASGRSLRYGALAEDAGKLPVPQKVALKDPAEWTIIGKPLPRLDTVEKTNGSQIYAIDVKLPDMLLAAIAQSPVFGGKLTGFDAKSITGMPGVRHVLAVGDNAVAVVADTWWQAKSALEKLPVTWDEGPNGAVDDKAIAAQLVQGLDATDAAVGHKIGDAAAVLAKAKRTVTATYATPFLNHATLEPMNCTARVDGNRVEVWVGTQNGDATLAAAAEAGGVPLENVRVNKYMLGGGFGRRGQQDYTRQAVLLAKQLPGKPVKLIWSREEDMQHGYYRPITQAKMTAALSDSGELEALHVRLSGQSIVAYLAPSRIQNGYDPQQFQGLIPAEFGYMAIPNLLIDHAMRNTHVPVGFWRGVNHNQNAVYVECFIDEVAAAAGKDPLEFRRTLLSKTPKHLAVLNAVAEKAGWGTPLPSGVFRGICQNCGFGSYTAAVAEVSVSPKGVLKILRIVAATDPGYVVNPDQVTAQVEGSFAYGLSALLYSQNTIDKGRVQEGNFDTYEVAHMEDMPKVETVLVPSGGFWGGVGEPTIAVAAPAVLNAIYAATGKRVRSLPLKQHDLSHA